MPDPKITGKNLSYDQTLPPFLARLRGQQTSNSQSPDPILAARRRPGHVRSASEEAEDAPVVVDEEGNVVQLEAGQSVEDGIDVARGTSKTEHGENKDGSADDTKEEREKEKVAGIGAAKKRKVGRIIGGGDDDDDAAAEDGSNGIDAAIAKAVKTVDKLTNELPRERPKQNSSLSSGKSAKKKAKKIKLSFGDDEA